jgi:hypothetical protein
MPMLFLSSSHFCYYLLVRPKGMQKWIGDVTIIFSRFGAKAYFGWKNANIEFRWYLLFSLFLLGVSITKTNFIEVRAEVPALI